jgi:hypothetical protein
LFFPFQIQAIVQNLTQEFGQNCTAIREKLGQMSLGGEETAGSDDILAFTNESFEDNRYVTIATLSKLD